MTNPIARPTFFEGEILPATDLVATVDYSRNQIARHERYLHSWGIAHGLSLNTNKPPGGQSYVTVTLMAGVAIDGTGREIVVPSDVQLNPSDFTGHVVPLPDASVWYPVFLSGLDQVAPVSTGLICACASSQSTRIQETFNIVYDAPGSENAVAHQTPPATADPPADGNTTLWRILLGFVQWDSTINQFHDAKTAPGGVQPTYVGVNAAEVISQSGSLLLATHPAGSGGNNPVMAVQIQEAANDGTLVFGKLNPDGTLVPVLTVAANGDLTAKGQVSGAVTPGSMQVQSGMAFDGMTVPLPMGIDPADVAAGKVTLHIHVSLRLDQLQPPTPAATWVPFPYECRVDEDTHQVWSRIQWRDMGTPATPGPILSSLCDYIVIAAVPAS